MDLIANRGASARRAGSLALPLIGGLLALAGCQATGAPGPAPSSASSASKATATGPAATASASPAVSIPGTHKATTAYQVSAPVSTVVVISHVGDIAVIGGSGSATSVTQQIVYSKSPPVTTRTIRGKTLTVSYTCRTQLACGVSYVIQVPRDATVQVTAGAGSIRLSGLAGRVTAKADVGLISATGLTSASADLTTGAGAISATFAAAPTAVRALARVGAITVRVPGSASYQVFMHAHVGKATVSVPQSSSAARDITASTDLGTIVIGAVA